MIIKIEIDDDGINPTILLIDNSKLSYIELSDIERNQIISIDNESIYSLITSLHIIYRERFNVDYPNKSE